MHSFSPRFALAIDEVGGILGHTYNFQVNNEDRLMLFHISHRLRILGEHECNRSENFIIYLESLSLNFLDSKIMDLR